MLRGLFPRLFSQFREAGIIRGRFTFADSGDTWSASDDTYVGFTATDAGTGLVTIAFPACRNLLVLSATLAAPTVGTVTDVRIIQFPPLTATLAKAGTMGIALYSMDGTEALEDPVDGSVLEMVLLCDK